MTNEYNINTDCGMRRKRAIWWLGPTATRYSFQLQAETPTSSEPPPFHGYRRNWLLVPDLLLLRVNTHSRRILEEHQIVVDKLRDGLLALGGECLLVELCGCHALILSNSHWGYVHCLHNRIFLLLLLLFFLFSFLRLVPQSSIFNFQSSIVICLSLFFLMQS